MNSRIVEEDINAREDPETTERRIESRILHLRDVKLVFTIQTALMVPIKIDKSLVDNGLLAS